MEFKTILKEVRISKGITQEELAIRIGVSKDSIRRLEGNKYKIPPYSTIYMISQVLNMPVEKLFWYENK